MLISLLISSMVRQNVPVFKTLDPRNVNSTPLFSGTSNPPNPRVSRSKRIPSPAYFSNPRFPAVVLHTMKSRIRHSLPPPTRITYLCERARGLIDDSQGTPRAPRRRTRRRLLCTEPG